MENIGEENAPIGEQQPGLSEIEDETLPSVIEKAKKPRKKRKTQSNSIGNF